MNALRTLLPALVFLVLLIDSAHAAVLPCVSCSDCNSKIANAADGDTVQLTANINDQPGNCISFGGKDNVIFDCLGNTINGDDAGYDYGIWLNDSSGGSNNNTIRNCIVTDFGFGLYLWSSSNNTIRNIIITTNSSTSQGGLYAEGSPYYRNDIDNSVTVDGKPVQYFDGYYKLCPNNQVLDYKDTYSQVAFVGCLNVTLNATVMVDSVYLFYTNNSRVYNVNSSYNYYGVYVSNSSNNTLMNITASSNFDIGLYIFPNSNNNTFANINANSNGEGVYLGWSYNNTLINVTANSNGNNGFYIDGTSNNKLTNINAISNAYGFYIDGSSNNTLTNVTISSNLHFGIYFAYENLYNTINSSRIENNTEYGIYLKSAYSLLYPRYNTFYNNYLNNSVNLGSNDAGNLNYWNATKSTGPNIIFGPYIGGNYWGTPTHSGCSDACADSDNNGYCDSSCILGVNNVDYLPLTDKDPPSLWFSSDTLSNLSTTDQNWIFVNVSADETLSSCTLNWYDGAWTNVSMTAAGNYCYVNMIGLTPGSYYFRVYGNDSYWNMNVTEDRQVSMAAPPPPPPPPPSIFNLTAFSVENLHLEIGKNFMVKVYLKNPDSQFANITVWLGGDCPASLAKFSLESGLYLTPDQRNVTVEMNPNSERTLSLMIISTVPRDGGYTLTMNANTTASATQSSDSLKIFIDYPPSFPGLESWGILLILAVSGLVYWKIKK